MLVVSQETLKGGQKVNEVRMKNGLNPLTIREIKLVNEEIRCWELEEEKISSSNGRLRLLGTLLRNPENVCMLLVFFSSFLLMVLGYAWTVLQIVKSYFDDISRNRTSLLSHTSLV